MIKNFKSELELIKDNERISDKLMIFSMYNEFYNSILGSADDYFIEHYAPFMEKTFELVVASANLQDDISLNVEKFMQVYFELLKKSRLSSMPQAKGTIDYFKNNLDAFIDSMGYVAVIDKPQAIPLGIKVDIMVRFREFINNMFRTVIELYDEESSKELRHGIKDMLTDELDGKFLKYYNDIIRYTGFSSVAFKGVATMNNGVVEYNLNQDQADFLKSMLMTSTKDYLFDKLSKGEFDFSGIQDETTKEFFGSFNELQQKIWLMGAIYGIAGYDRNDKSNEKEKLAEMCKMLGISKAKYTTTAISMALTSAKFMKKQMAELDSETFDGDDTPKRKRK